LAGNLGGGAVLVVVAWDLQQEMAIPHLPLLKYSFAFLAVVALNVCPSFQSIIRTQSSRACFSMNLWTYFVLQAFLLSLPIWALLLTMYETTFSSKFLLGSFKNLYHCFDFICSWQALQILEWS
jgi:hypothetical protein